MSRERAAQQRNVAQQKPLEQRDAMVTDMTMNIWKMGKMGFGGVFMGTVKRFALPALIWMLTIGVLLPIEAAAKGGDTIWAIGDTQAHRQESVASVIDTAGNIIMTGYRNLKADPDDSYWTVKYNTDGSIAWRAAYDFPNPSLKTSDQGTAIAVDSNNDVIVTGYVYNGLNKDIYTVKYNGATGAVVWSDTFNGAASGNDAGTAIAVDKVNNVVYVGGYSQNASGNDDYIILKYNNSASGANPPALTPFIYNGPAAGSDRIASIVVGVDFVAATGKSWNGTLFDILTVKYDFGGTKLWERRYTSGGLLGDVGKIVALDSSGNVVITGSSGNALDYDIYTAKYSGADGTILWQRTYNGAFDDEPSGLVVDTAGNVYITGYTWTMSGNNDFYTARYNGITGAVVWQQIFDSGKGNTDVAIPTGIVVEDAANGDLYVTGYTESAGNYDFQTVKYRKSSGHMLWNRSYNSPVSKADRPIGIGLASNGNVITVGWSDRTAPLDGGPTQATSGTQNTIQVNGKAWTTNQWQDYFLTVTSGANAGAVRQITGNTGDTLSVGVNFGSAITAGTTYYIYDKDDYDIFVIKYDQGTLNPATNLQAQTVSKDGNSKYTIRLTWEDNSSDETGFIIERKAGEYGAWAEVTRVGADTTSYDDGLLDENNYYYYRVKTYRLSEESYPSTEAHALTILMSFTGPIWQYIYNSSYNLDDFATAIGVGPDNNPVVTGRSDSGLVGMFDYYTIKLNSSTKAVIWSDRYDSMQNEMDMAVCLAVDNTNNITISGISAQYFAPAQMNINSLFTIKYPSTGAPLIWEKQYNGPGGIDDRAAAVASATDGSSTIVVGYGKNSSNNDDIYVVKYLADGTQLWAATPYNGGRNDYPSGVAIDPSGNVIVTGYRQNGTGLPSDTNNYDFFTAKYNGTTGALIWSDIYNVTGTGDNKAKGVVTDSAGDVYITGYATNASANEDFYTIKYNGTNGTRIWERSYNGPVNGNDRAVAIKLDPIVGNGSLDGNIVVVGTQLTSAGDQDIHVIRYSTAGTVMWERTIERIGTNETAVDAALDGAGYIYIAGDTGSDLDKDMLGAIYDYEGTFLGGITYNGANGHDEASAITPNHQGEAFIAGYSTNASGNSDYAVLKMKNNYILVPTPFTVTPISDYSKMNLAWQNNTAGTTLHIERTLGPVTQNSTWDAIATVNPGGISYQDTGLTAGVNYCYRIEATSGTLMSRKVVTCATTTLTPPTNVTLTGITTTSITINWANVTGNTGYKIERMPAGGQWADLTPSAQNITTYTNSGLTAGTTYSYRVSTNSISGYSNPSSVQSAPTLPVAPNLTVPVIVSTTQVNLSWNAVTGATGYRLERKQGSGGTWGTATTTTGLSYNDTTLTYNTQYYYRVFAYNTSGDSASSNEQGALTPFTATTVNTVAAASQSIINISWSDVAGETGYAVQESYCNNNTGTCNAYFDADSYWTGWTTVTTTAADVTTYQRTGLTAGYDYRYRIIVNTTGNTSLPSNRKGAWTWLAQPTISAISPVSETSLKLDWNNIYGESNYTVERKLGTGGTWAAVPAGTGLGENTITFTDTGLGLQTNYCYRLLAYNSIVNANNTAPPSVYSSNEPCMTTPLPAPSLNVLTVPSTTEIDLSWNNVTGNTGYEVERCVLSYPNNPEYAQYGDSYFSGCTVLTPALAADTTSFQNTGLTVGYTYKYRVRDLYTGGVSGWSNSRYATTIPAAPVMSTPTAISQTAATISWGDVNGDTGFKLEWQQDSGSWNLVNIGQNTLIYAHSGLTSTSTYSYKVRAKNTSGDSSYSSTVSVLAAPALNTLSNITISSIGLSWNNITGNNGYTIERKTGSGGTWGTLTSVAINTINYTDNTCAAGTLYYYRVRAINTIGTGLLSNEQSATTTPAKPNIALLSISTTGIDLAWALKYGATNYKINRKTGTGGTYSEIINLPITYSESYCGYAYPTVSCPTISPTTTHYQNTGLQENTLYCYQITGWNSTGGDSVLSDEKCMTTDALPSAALTAAALNSFTVKLDWTPGSCPSCESADGYDVERKQGGAGFGKIAEVPVASGNTFTQRSGIDPNTSYSYRVRPYKKITDDFATGINSSIWSQEGIVRSGTGTIVQDVTTPPINIVNANGNAQINPTSGLVEMTTTSPGGGLANVYNELFLTWSTPANIHDDFEVSVDYTLPLGAGSPVQYHVYGRLKVNFLNSTGGTDYIYVERSKGNYVGVSSIEGVVKSINMATTDTSGKLRIGRSNGKVYAAASSNGVWNNILETTCLSAIPATYVGLSQHAQRNESISVTANFDNFVAYTDKSAYSNEASAKTPVYVQGAGTCP